MATPTTVDEGNLTVKCASLKALAIETQIKLDKIVKAHDMLTMICRPDGESGTESPPDERTGAPMTDATRLDIYNAVIAEADQLLGATAEEEDD